MQPPRTRRRFSDSRLLTKLLAVIAVVIVLGTAGVWASIDYFAADYFADLLEKYHVPKKDEVMKMFLDAAHGGLVWASFLSLALGLVLSFLLIRMILGPLYQMISITRKVASGDYTPRVLISSEDEIGELGRSFNAMTDNLQRIEELRKKMMVDVAHELRAPLTNIRGYLEALSTGVMPYTPGVIESLNEEALRLGNLTEDLMRLSVADAARLTMRKKPVDLRVLVNQSVQLCETHFSDKHITVEIQVDDAGDAVPADSEKLAQVIQNILDNAWRYAEPGGRLRITAERSTGGLRIVFSNTGEPIGDEHLALIFERFYRVDPSRSRLVGGAGIGLAIVKELIEAHGGQVGAESAEGENRIWFSVPA